MVQGKKVNIYTLIDGIEEEYNQLKDTMKKIYNYIYTELEWPHEEEKAKGWTKIKLYRKIEGLLKPLPSNSDEQ